MNNYLITYCNLCEYPRDSKPKNIDLFHPSGLIETYGNCIVCGAYLEGRNVNDEELKELYEKGPVGNSKEEVIDYVVRKRND